MTIKEEEGIKLEKVTALAFLIMERAARKEEKDLVVSDGFLSGVAIQARQRDRLRRPRAPSVHKLTVARENGTVFKVRSDAVITWETVSRPNPNGHRKKNTA